MGVTPPSVLGAGFLAEVDADLAETDAHLARAYPGEDGRRQPVHTVYVSAADYTQALTADWGQRARDLVADNGGAVSLCAEIGVPDQLQAVVGREVDAKLAQAPIEDLRIDFEDGYRAASDDVEDAHAVSTATALADSIVTGEAPSFFGIRFKCFEAATRRRGIRTLDLFLGALLPAVGEVPGGLVVTLPKVSTVSQVEAMVRVCEKLEAAHDLASGSLRFEVQVETPPLIIGSDGRMPVAAAVHAGAGRVTSLHYGTYDYSASLQIAAAHQTADHPAADFAKQIMQVAVAGTGVHLSDGSTNIIPAGSPDQVRQAWRNHSRLVRRSLERGIYQGWDMHPGHLPTRFATTFAFFREGYPRAAQRLADYIGHTGGQDVMDEPATARALAQFLHRGLRCGALVADEVQVDTGLSADQIGALATPGSDTQGFMSDRSVNT